MTYGPIDILALEFKGNKFDGSIMASLLDLVEREIIRIIDLVLVAKDAEGKLVTLELQELDPEAIAVFDPLHANVTSMITENDIEAIAELEENNSSVAIMLYENLWAIKTKEAMLAAGGRVLLQERIPHEVVLEELAAIAARASSAS